MRVRLYELGTMSRESAFRFDRFPVTLCISSDGDVDYGDHGSPAACELIDIGGQIVIQVPYADMPVEVNDALLESGPLMPGDRLCLGKHEYLVSYERTAVERPPSVRCRI